MNHYYLIAQLPSLDGLSDASPLPITDEEFLELCGRFLDEKSMKPLRGLTLVPPRKLEETGSALLDAWNRQERALRLALGNVRSETLKKAFDPGEESFSTPLIQVARTAAEMENPLLAEEFLYQHRIHVLNELRPLDEFGLDYLLYYGLRLKLMQRIRLFNTEHGRESYRNIYESILCGGNQENEI